jgi:3-oxosteroid 1-dehydrogenase
MKNTGIEDSEEDAYHYLKQLVGDAVCDKRLMAYVKEAPEMLRFMEKNSLIKYEAAPAYADYYPEMTGGKAGARSLDPIPYSRRKLGAVESQLRPPTHGQVLDRFTLTAKEAHAFLNFTFKTYLLLLKRLANFYLDIPFRLAKRPDNRLTLGAALVGRLRKTMENKGIPLWLNTVATSFLEESGKIVGVEVQREGKLETIRVKKGVLLACGGFAHNAAMRKHYHPKLNGSQWSVACAANTGDGINMGVAAGAQLDLMSSAWWTPTMLLPGGRAEALIIGKSMPGCIMVNKKGKRFTNDAGPYEDVVKGQMAADSDESPAIPCYLIFDARYRHNYMLGTALPPGKVMPDNKLPEILLSSGWLKKTDTLRQLAEQCGIDAETLLETVDRHNEFARTGKDLDFGRGDSMTDRYYSDHSVAPNSCMAPIQEAPFYAVEIFPGDLGTKGGLLCDEFARVLGHNMQPVSGLYATGNCSASVMGDSYPGAGSTIGPSMTFAFIAARHAAGLSSKQ